MRFSPSQLEDLAPAQLPRVVVVFGAEPLLRKEAEDRVRALAREAGATERVLHSVTTGFDWSELGPGSQTLSLFASRRLVEIHSENAAWGRAGSDQLKALAADRESPDFLLVRFGALEARQFGSGWFGALEQDGALVEARPVGLSALPGWLSTRAQRMGLTLTHDAADLIAERMEGNLLAAHQALEKLALTYPAAQIDVDTIVSQTSDDARFDIFRLVDAALDQDLSRAQRILEALRLEGVEPVLIVWAFDRELHRLASVAETRRMGGSVEGCLRSLNVRNDAARRRLGGLAGRLPKGRAHRLLVACRRVDRIVKGVDPSYRLRDPWLALNWLIAAVSEPSVSIDARAEWL